MTMPGWSFVLALKSLQKAMMFTPCWPRAGPTGGAGFACPAGICNLIIPVTFLAIKSAFFHLPVFEFHRRISSENIHRHLELAAFGLDFFNHAAKIQERPVVDFYRLAHFEADLRFLVLFGRRDLVLDRFNFIRRRWRWRLAAHETNHPLRCLNEI